MKPFMNSPLNSFRPLSRVFSLGLLSSIAVLFLASQTLWAACVTMSETITGPSCAAVGSSVTFVISWTGSWTGKQIYYDVGFGDSTTPNDGNVKYYYSSGNSSTCGGGGPYVSGSTGAYYAMASSTNSTSTTWIGTVPAVGYTIADIILLSKNQADGTSPHCDGSSCTDVTTLPFTVCVATATPTKTGTKTYTPTITLTPTPVPSATKTFTSTNTPFGGIPTNTFTYTPSPTPSMTNTPTATITSTPTITNTPLPTNTPVPLPCNYPVGANTQNFQGGAYCFSNQAALLDCTKVFGLSLADLRNVADYVGSTAGAGTTLTIGSDWKLSFFDGNLTYGVGNPAPYDRLHAYGILVVNGDLTLNGGAGSTLPSSYGGVVFVTGNLVITNGSEIDGAVIMGSPYFHASGGTVNMSGSAGNFGTINYSPSLVTQAQKLVAQYREDISQRSKLLAVPLMQ